MRLCRLRRSRFPASYLVVRPLLKRCVRCTRFVSHFLRRNQIIARQSTGKGKGKEKGGRGKGKEGKPPFPSFPFHPSPLPGHTTTFNAGRPNLERDFAANGQRLPMQHELARDAYRVSHTLFQWLRQRAVRCCTQAGGIRLPVQKRPGNVNVRACVVHETREV